jgi:putative oxidoreductase
MLNILLVFGNWGITILRIIFGVIFIKHGWPKIKSLKDTAKSFSEMGFKPGIFWGTIVALLEFVGGWFLIFGLLTQIVSLLLALQFLVILFTLKRKSSFKDYEYDLLILAVALALMVLGGGNLSLDNLLF